MQTSLSPNVCRVFLGCQPKKAVDELNLSKKITSCHPSSLPLPDHVDRFVALDRSPGRLKFSEALLGIHSTFDGSMILFENVVQVLYRPVPATAAKCPFLLYVRDGRAVDRCLIGVDDTGLRMRRIAQCLAKQPFGGLGVAQCRKQKIDCGSTGIDGSIQVAPATLHSNIGLIDTPGLVGRLEMTPHPLFQFRTIPLHPTPDRGVVRLQTALGQQLFDVAERERVPKIPADCAENDFWRRLPPLEDRRPSYILHGLFRLPATASNVATQPFPAACTMSSRINRRRWPISLSDTQRWVRKPRTYAVLGCGSNRVPRSEDRPIIIRKSRRVVM